MAQDEITNRIICAAREGKNVVHLKSGDPDVFGRGAEEKESLQAAGIPFETVPGVTAALATAAYVGVPLTHGDQSSAIALVTGQEKRDKQGCPIDYGALANFPGTVIIYMGVSSPHQWCRPLIQRGRSPDTPVMIVRRCTWSNQQSIRCTLGTLERALQEHGIRPPAVIVVGDVVRLAPETTWFAGRPLIGSRVLVTRPRAQAKSLTDKLTELGADVLFQPAIEISDPPNWATADEAMGRIREYDWLVFSSANGVSYFLDRFWSRRNDLRDLATVKLAAIGPGTAKELARYRLSPDLMPRQYRAEDLAEALAPHARGCRFLLARASRGRELLAQELEAAGALVEQVVVYASLDVEHPSPAVAEDLARGRIDWVTVTSSAIARSLVRMFGMDLKRAKLASISPVTSAVLRQLGCQATVEASDYTMDGLVEAILEWKPN
jgi:uroporphyrinogen III methyltransferase/synthase